MTSNGRAVCFGTSGISAGDCRGTVYRKQLLPVNEADQLRKDAPDMTICRMSPRPRKDLDERSLEGQFGKQFQDRMNAAGLSVADLRERLTAHGHKFSDSGVRKWMRGESFPPPDVMLTLAVIFDEDDYRHILPQIRTPRRRK